MTCILNSFLPSHLSEKESFYITLFKKKEIQLECLLSRSTNIIKLEILYSIFFSGNVSFKLLHNFDYQKKSRRNFSGHFLCQVARLFNEAAQMSPDDADIHIVLGVLYNLSREYDKAIASFKTALKLKPRDYSLWNKLGATQANSVQSADAILAYQQVETRAELSCLLWWLIHVHYCFFSFIIFIFLVAILIGLGAGYA